ncbi:MAG: HD domain-containing protein [Myxococcales bacterium]|nr:HD domain-containing protein [Myxococcales bacterium]
MSHVPASGHPYGNEPEDLLRLACQVAQTGVSLPDEVALAARAVAPEVSRVRPEKVRGALASLLLAPHPSAGLQWLHRCGALELVMPELAATVDFSQEAGRRHKDVWEHTKQVVLQSAADPIVRWAALLHDIGKVPTRVMHPNGKVTFHRHAEVGARMFDKISRRLEFDRDTRQEIRFLIYNHLRANAYSKGWTDAAVRRFDKEMGPRLERLIQLSLADVTSRRPGRRQEAALNVEELMRRILEIRALDAQMPPLPPGLGNAIMQAFALPPSRQVGELRALCEKAVDAGQLEERQEPSYYVAYLVAQGFGAGRTAEATAPTGLASTCGPEEGEHGPHAAEVHEPPHRHD